MARVSAQEFTEKWGRRLKGAVTDIQKGIEKVTKAPGESAAAAKDRMKMKLLAAIDDGTWERMVKSVTLDEWKKQARDKGVGRISAGVDGAAQKVEQMAGRLLEAVDASVAEANKIPKGDIEASIQRSNAFIRGMAKRKLRRA